MLLNIKPMKEISIENEINFMIEYQLDGNEMFLFKLIYLAQEGHSEMLKKYFTNTNILNIQNILVSLQNKGIINKSYTIPEKGTIFKPQDVELNKNVVKTIYKFSQDLGMELFEAYPAFTTINGKVFSLRNISKKFNNFDEYCFEYGMAIKFNPEKHKEILDILEDAKNENLINSGLCSFVIDRQWETLKLVRDSDMGMLNTNELL